MNGWIDGGSDLFSGLSSTGLHWVDAYSTVQKKPPQSDEVASCVDAMV